MLAIQFCPRLPDQGAGPRECLAGATHEDENPYFHNNAGREYRIREPDNRAVSFSPVILAGAGIQSPDCAPTRSWQQIFGGWTAASHPALFPSAQPSLHTTRALDSRCDENDGVGLPDSHCGSKNGYQVTSSYLPLHGTERGHRNADNGQALTRLAFWWTVSTVVQYNLSGRFPARDSQVELLPGIPTAAPGETKGYQSLVTAPVSRRGAGAAERARLEIA